MQWSNRPVVLLGNGARGADMDVILSMGVPVLTSWQAKDMVDNRHANYFGSPGIYGQRMANAVLAHADMVLSIGNRLSIWNVGHEGLRNDQRLVQVEIDEAEIKDKAQAIRQDARTFVESLRGERVTCVPWLADCAGWRASYPLVEKAHDDANGYINSYRFVEALEPYLRPDEVIVTEMGAALCSAHQVLRIRPPQRLMTSGGLGEMGCGLPGAIGASIARNRGPVLLLATDGGLMMNLQELQTVVHHELPIRIIVFNNSGYGMLRETQRKGGMRYAGVDADTGVSFPNFRHVAQGFGITACEVRDWDDFHRIVPSVMAIDEKPILVDYIMDPRQPLVPKLGYSIVDGNQVYDRFDDLYPKESHA